jgi:hypothetical protein
MGGDLSYSRSDGWTTFDLMLPLEPHRNPKMADSAIELEQV